MLPHEQYRAQVQKVVAAAPPLTGHQVARLVAIMRPTDPAAVCSSAAQKVTEAEVTGG